jgi:ribonuclease HI
VPQVIENKSNRPPQIEKLIMASDELSQRFGDSVLLQWILGHTGLLENERADHLAREGGQSIPTSENAMNVMLFEKARI